MRRIVRLFSSPGARLVPFFTAGFPSLEATLPLVRAAERAGAAMVELGVPFSDPLADGPIIQQTSQVALENGTDLPWILDTVAALRADSDMPVVLMGYANPILRFGVEAFLARARDAGVDGLIIPDLPPGEDAGLFAAARERGLSTVFLVAPNTPDQRIRHLGREAGDLLYAASLLGVTGATLSGRDELNDYFQRVRAASPVPFIAGFGIATPEDVRLVAPQADGVVVGSALLARLRTAPDPVAAAFTYLQSMAAALPRDPEPAVEPA